MDYQCSYLSYVDAFKISKFQKLRKVKLFTKLRQFMIDLIKTALTTPLRVIWTKSKKIICLLLSEMKSNFLMR